MALPAQEQGVRVWTDKKCDRQGDATLTVLTGLARQLS